MLVKSDSPAVAQVHNTLSVLISIYAKEKPDYLAECLQSLADQTRRAEQVVLVEDGPVSDDLKGVIERFRPILQIDSVRLKENIGLAGALNEGLRYCDGKFIARMDSDDVCLPTRFEKQLRAFETDPTLDVVGSFATEIDGFGSRGAIRRMPTSHEAIVHNVWACPFIHPSVVFKRHRVLEIGGYSADIRRSEDYELWFRCVSNGLRFHNISEPLLLYRFDRKSHDKQKLRFAFERSLTGYRGAAQIRAAWWKRLACFTPLVRSLLPQRLQHHFYGLMRHIDPRQAGNT